MNKVKEFILWSWKQSKVNTVLMFTFPVILVGGLLLQQLGVI